MIFSEDYWKSEGEMKKVLPVSSGLSWVKMSPLLENAMTDYLVPVIGQPLTDEISWIYEKIDPSERSEVEKMVLYLAQRAVANLAFWSNFDMFSLRISDQGFQRQQSDSWQPAFKYQEDNLRMQFANTGFNALDQLLVTLEDHMDDFTNYKIAPVYLATQKNIVRSTEEIQDIYEINNSRLVYLRLQPIIRQLQELTLQPIMGDSIYDALVTYLNGGEQEETYADVEDATWEKLRNHARKVVVMAAVRQLLRTTGTVTDRGAYFAEYGGGGGTMTAKVVDNTRLSLLISDAERAMNGYTARLTTFIKINFSDTFGGASLRVFDRDNDDKKAFWA